MTPRRTSRLAIRLLEHVVHDEPLAGDLLESSHDRPIFWLWRQVVLAAFVSLAGRIRTGVRETLETWLVGTAMLALLGFSAVVAASLFNRLLALIEPSWLSGSARYEHGQVLAALASLAAAAAIGSAIGGVHRSHRVAAIVALAVSASAAAFLNLYLFVPSAMAEPFVADGALPIALAALFIGGLFIGIGARSTCDVLPPR